MNINQKGYEGIEEEKSGELSTNINGRAEHLAEYTKDSVQQREMSAHIGHSSNFCMHVCMNMVICACVRGRPYELRITKE